MSDREQIVAAVREFERDVVPVASELEHADQYPAELVAAMAELGLFGMTIPERYGGLGIDLVTYAEVNVDLSRGWMSLSQPAGDPNAGRATGRRVRRQRGEALDQERDAGRPRGPARAH